MTEHPETTLQPTDDQPSGVKPVWRKPGVFVYEVMNAESAAGSNPDADGPHS